MKLIIQTFMGQKYEINVEKDDTIGTLKLLILNKLGVFPWMSILTYRESNLEDQLNSTIKSLNIQENS